MCGLRLEGGFGAAFESEDNSTRDSDESEDDINNEMDNDEENQVDGPEDSGYAKQEQWRYYQAAGREESSIQRSQYYRPIPSHIEYATAIPRTEQTSGQQYLVSENTRPAHKRWVTREFVDAHQELRADSALTCDCIGHCRKDYCACYRHNLRCTTQCQPSLASERRPECDNTEASRLYSAWIEAIRNGDEEIILKENDPLDTQTMGSRNVSADIPESKFTTGALQATKNSWDRYEYPFGDPRLRLSMSFETRQLRKHGKRKSITSTARW